MEEKLISVVEAYFKEDELKTNRDLIQEISGNLVERYHELVGDGISEQEAYEKCLVYLGNLQSISNPSYDVEAVSAKPLSIYFISVFAVASVILFFINTFVSLLILLMGIGLFYIEYRRQLVLFSSNREAKGALRLMTWLHKYLIPVWCMTGALIFLESLAVIFSNLDKLTISLILNSEPHGFIFLFCLVMYVLGLLPAFAYHNRIVERYIDLTEENATKLKYKLFKNRKKKIDTYLDFQKRSFSILALLTGLNLAVALLSRVQIYALAFDMETGDIIGWMLQNTETMLNHILTHRLTFAAVILGIVVFLIIYTLIAGIFVKKMRSSKLIFIWNNVWFLGVLIYALSYEFMTGIDYRMSTNIGFSAGMIMIIATYLITKQTWKVLFYES